MDKMFADFTSDDDRALQRSTSFKNTRTKRKHEGSLLNSAADAKNRAEHLAARSNGPAAWSSPGASYATPITVDNGSDPGLKASLQMNGRSNAARPRLPGSSASSKTSRRDVLLSPDPTIFSPLSDSNQSSLDHVAGRNREDGRSKKNETSQSVVSHMAKIGTDLNFSRVIKTSFGKRKREEEVPSDSPVRALTEDEMIQKKKRKYNGLGSQGSTMGNLGANRPCNLPGQTKYLRAPSVEILSRTESTPRQSESIIIIDDDEDPGQSNPAVHTYYKSHTNKGAHSGTTLNEEMTATRDTASRSGTPLMGAFSHGTAMTSLAKEMKGRLVFEGPTTSQAQEYNGSAASGGAFKGAQSRFQTAPGAAKEESSQQGHFSQESRREMAKNADSHDTMSRRKPDLATNATASVSSTPAAKDSRAASANAHHSHLIDRILGPSRHEEDQVDELAHCASRQEVTVTRTTIPHSEASLLSRKHTSVASNGDIGKDSSRTPAVVRRESSQSRLRHAHGTSSSVRRGVSTMTHSNASHSNNVSPNYARGNAKKSPKEHSLGSRSPGLGSEDDLVDADITYMAAQQLRDEAGEQTTLRSEAQSGTRLLHFDRPNVRTNAMNSFDAEAMDSLDPLEAHGSPKMENYMVQPSSRGNGADMETHTPDTRRSYYHAKNDEDGSRETFKVSRSSDSQLELSAEHGENKSYTAQQNSLHEDASLAAMLAKHSSGGRDYIPVNTSAWKQCHQPEGVRRQTLQGDDNDYTISNGRPTVPQIDTEVDYDHRKSERHKVSISPEVANTQADKAIDVDAELLANVVDHSVSSQKHLLPSLQLQVTAPSSQRGDASCNTSTEVQPPQISRSMGTTSLDTIPNKGIDRRAKTFLSMPEVQEAMEKHLKEMQIDHEYKIKQELHRALSHHKHKFEGLESELPSAAPNGMTGIVHQSSPFENMQPIGIPLKKKADANDKSRIYTESYRNSKVSSKDEIACPISTHNPEEPEVPSYTGDMPRYTHYISVKRNVLGHNTKQMHVWPYFGMESDYAAGEGKVQQDLRNEFDIDVLQWPRKVYRSQQVKSYTPYVESFLEEIGCSMSDILYYLLEPDEKVIESASEGCRRRNSFCTEDLNRSSSRWVKVLSSLPQPSAQNIRKAALACNAFSIALPRFTEYSKNLTMWHVARKSQAASLNEERDRADVASYSLACRICHLHDCPYHGEVREFEHSSEAEDSLSIASEDALDTDYPPNINYKLRVALPSESYEDHSETIQSTKHYKSKKHVDWWMENSLSWDHSRRGPFYPCSHPGQSCDQAKCRCFRDKVHCEKACQCSVACDRRFRGCSCKRTSKKRCLQDDRCECFKLNRECDPDLCGTCGVDLLLNRENRDTEELFDTCCRNAGIQLGLPKRTILGASKVHGFGLFAGEHIRQHEFVGEYVGEIISKAETERRGTIYEVQKLSYLFALNRDQEIDSQRFGNKIRFINHADPGSRYRNIYPKIMLCNMAHRIGMFALKDIQAEQELFFDYGKDYHQHLVSREPNEPDEAVVPKTKNRALIDTFDEPGIMEEQSQAAAHVIDKHKSSKLKQIASHPRSPLGPEQTEISKLQPGKDASDTRRRAAIKSQNNSSRHAVRMKDSTIQILPISRVTSNPRSHVGKPGSSRMQTPMTMSPLRNMQRSGPAIDADGDEDIEDHDIFANIPFKDTEDDYSEYDDTEEVADSEEDNQGDESEDSPKRSTRARKQSLRVKTTRG